MERHWALDLNQQYYILRISLRQGANTLSLESGEQGLISSLSYLTMFGLGGVLTIFDLDPLFSSTEWGNNTHLERLPVACVTPWKPYVDNTVYYYLRRHYMCYLICILHMFLIEIS